MQHIKDALREQLEKNGHTLMDLEEALAKINTAEGVFKYAQIMKSAATGEDDGFIRSLLGKALGGVGSVVGAVPGIAGSLANISATGAIVGGGALGAGALGLQRHLENQDKSLDKHRAEGDRLHALIKRLEMEHGVKP